VSDLTPLINLNRLTTINLTNNEVSDLSPVGAIADLKQVWVRGNPLSSETLTIVVPALREAGIFVVGI
jgi:Leucine-rich repeat (LRR) protein